MLNCQYCNISPSPAALSTSGIVTRECERFLVPVHPHNFNLLKGDDEDEEEYGEEEVEHQKRRNRLKASQVPQLP